MFMMIVELPLPKKHHVYNLCFTEELIIQVNVEIVRHYDVYNYIDEGQKMFVYYLTPVSFLCFDEYAIPCKLLNGREIQVLGL